MRSARGLWAAAFVLGVVLLSLIVDLFFQARQLESTRDSQALAHRPKSSPSLHHAPPAPARKSEAIDVAEILSKARLLFDFEGASRDVHGILRSGSLKLPVGVYLRGKDAQLAFHDPDSKESIRYHLRRVDGRRDLFKIASGRTVRLSEEACAEGLAGTELSFEDFTTPWLNWSTTELRGVERVRGGRAWKIRLVNPDGGGSTAQVQIWVHKKTGLVVRTVGYNREGRPMKRLEVTSVRKAAEGWVPRRVRVDRIDPLKNKVVALTYLELEEPKALK